MPSCLVSHVFPHTPPVNWNKDVSPSVNRNLPTPPRPFIGEERGLAPTFPSSFSTLRQLQTKFGLYLSSMACLMSTEHS